VRLIDWNSFHLFSSFFRVVRVRSITGFIRIIMVSHCGVAVFLKHILHPQNILLNANLSVEKSTFERYNRSDLIEKAFSSMKQFIFH
jgi:hypothetical protein